MSQFNRRTGQLRAERGAAVFLLAYALFSAGAFGRANEGTAMRLAYGQTEITVPRATALKKVTSFEFEEYVLYERNGGREILSLTFSQLNPPMSRSEARNASWLCLNGMNAWRVSTHGTVTEMMWRSESPDKYILARYPAWSRRAQELLSTFRRVRGYPGPTCDGSRRAPYSP